MNRTHVVIVGFVVIGSMLSMTAGWAAEASNYAPPTDPIEREMIRYHLHPALNKLGRGIGNILTGWMEIPCNVQSHYYYKDPVNSSLGGGMIGLGKAIGRTLVGAYETVTFFLPYPPQFEPILPPLEPFRSREQPLAAPR